MQNKNYLLVGGSNCLIKDGLGQVLQEELPGNWTNVSLGNSTSLRAADILLNSPELVDEADFIFLEYTLNDLIFEIAATLDPNSHFRWLDAICSVENIRKKLVVLILGGSQASVRYGQEPSFVLTNYRDLVQQHDLKAIDLFDFIKQERANSDFKQVFRDVDHFSSPMVAKLVQKIMSEFDKISASETVAGRAGAQSTTLHVLDVPAIEAENKIKSVSFQTRLLTVPVIPLGLQDEITITSPGGTFVGVYAVIQGKQGYLNIEHPRGILAKSARSRMNYSKPRLALRHFTHPVETQKGDKITLRHTQKVGHNPSAVLDHTQGQIVPSDPVEDSIDIGGMLFLKSA